MLYPIVLIIRMAQVPANNWTSVGVQVQNKSQSISVRTVFIYGVYV